MPLRLNDGTPVSDDVMRRTKEDLLAQFGGISFQPDTIFGTWLHQGQQYEDELARLVVDVEDTAENRQFFVDWKSTLLTRFDQIEIYMVSYPIERI